LFYEADDDTSLSVEKIGRFLKTDLTGYVTGDFYLKTNGTPPYPKDDVSHALDTDTLDMLKGFYTGITPNQIEAFVRFNLSSNVAPNESDRYQIDLNSVKLEITTTTAATPGTLIFIQ
jgi:hypothetical protein